VKKDGEEEITVKILDDDDDDGQSQIDGLTD
jgi:hypothetical protein